MSNHSVGAILREVTVGLAPPPEPVGPAASSGLAGRPGGLPAHDDGRVPWHDSLRLRGDDGMSTVGLLEGVRSGAVQVLATGGPS